MRKELGLGNELRGRGNNLDGVVLDGKEPALGVRDDLATVGKGHTNFTTGEDRQYGLVASVFTPDRAVFNKCRDELQFGLVNWNRPTLELSTRLPIGGLKKSGNFSPGGVAAAVHLSVPMSALENEITGFPGKLEPGLNWT